MNFEEAFGPDDIIGAGDFIFGGKLSADALIDLFGGPTAGFEALHLGCAGTGDTNDGIELGLGAGLEQERNCNNRFGSMLISPLIDLRPPERANARVQNSFELVTGIRVGKNPAREQVAAKAAIRTYHCVTESLLDLR